MGTDIMVRLNGMEFYAYHGCLESERRDGNRFRVDIEYDYDMGRAASSDDLSEAVSYADIYGIVKQQMAVPSNLLENVAYRILEAIKAAFPKITSASVTVTKFNPPVGGETGSASVTYSF